MKNKSSFQDKITAFSQAIGNNRYLLSLRDGFMVAFPATMFGSIMVILQNLPTTLGLSLPQSFLDFLNNFFGPVGNRIGNLIIHSNGRGRCGQ